MTSEADHERAQKAKSNGKPPKQTAKNKQASHKKRLKVSEKENAIQQNLANNSLWVTSEAVLF